MIVITFYVYEIENKVVNKRKKLNKIPFFIGKFESSAFLQNKIF